MKIGALEAGGTKMVCAIGDENGNIIERISIPTETPEITMPKIIEFFKAAKVEAIGVGCFGPVDLNRASAQYGYITSTPKLSWRNFDILGNLKRELNVPIGFDTDVNASALGEATYGITKGLDVSIYITIGTGVGVGVFINGQLLHGMLHPEAGHILLERHKEDTFGGSCPYHQNCFEGLASGPAIGKRYGKSANELSDCDEVWKLEAYYIAQALYNYTCMFSPNKIVLGGGVMHQKQLYPLIREEFKKIMNGYIDTKEVRDLENFIIAPSLNDNQGILGCLELANREMRLLL
ncbi:ROK family protein [Lachnoclostridium phytofermentans]|uniref:fructokinase n=1 Tax=Lachnoclostridium phytofermentans (strain ATCC 700394 / DSM 18823 / ISDg) TaxID=357809 RepID=A9KQN9_LACP7|nr:ROK family protein [Lachnoclostridium phytofermentans]ABX41952.1 ROK family protein [Lachnoclostridium phytofermentans ISDg]